MQLSIKTTYTMVIGYHFKVKYKDALHQSDMQNVISKKIWISAMKSRNNTSLTVFRTFTWHLVKFKKLASVGALHRNSTPMTAPLSVF